MMQMRAATQRCGSPHGEQPFFACKSYTNRSLDTRHLLVLPRSCANASKHRFWFDASDAQSSVRRTTRGQRRQAEATAAEQHRVDCGRRKPNAGATRPFHLRSPALLGLSHRHPHVRASCLRLCSHRHSRLRQCSRTFPQGLPLLQASQHFMLHSFARLTLLHPGTLCSVSTVPSQQVTGTAFPSPSC